MLPTSSRRHVAAHARAGLSFFLSPQSLPHSKALKIKVMSTAHCPTLLGSWVRVPQWGMGAAMRL